MRELTPWQSCLIDVSEDDDLSQLVDLGSEFYIGLLLDVPPLDSTKVTILLCTTLNGTFRTLQKSDGSGDWEMATGTGDKIVCCVEAGGYRYLKLATSVSQTADRQFWVRGIT